MIGLADASVTDGLQVDLLGPVEVRRAGTVVPVPGRQERRVLALLALHTGERVPADFLADLLWGEWPPRTAGKTLQAVVSRLRSCLGSPDMIGWRDGGYLLRLPPDAVDALRFRRLAGLGRDRLRADDPGAAADQLRRALSLWRADQPADLGEGSGAAAHDALVEERLSTLEDRLAADLALGHHYDLIASLQELTETRPYRERFAELLMLALHRCGRHADALALFDRVRRRLADDLGCDPSPALVELRGRIAARDPDLLPRPAGPPGNLPAELSSFLGREELLAAVTDLLAGHRLVTLTGPGGIGKTRLALATARAAAAGHSGGTWLVDLAAVASDDAVPAAVAAVLRGHDATADAVVAVLGRRRALLVLDNCEHVLGAVRPLLDRVLRDCPQVSVLATSRELLAVAGEHAVEIPPLEPGAAARLFAERARATDSSYVADDGDRRVVRDICRRVDHLPLGIELAAARVRALPLPEIERQLERSLRLLVSARSGRHHSLAETIGWSYDMLAAPQQQALQLLSVFTGSFTLPAAERVCALAGVPAEEVVALVGELTDRSLLSLVTPDRYRMLQTVRSFTAGRLAAAGRVDEARTAQATALTELAESLAAQQLTSAEAEAARHFEVEYDDLRAAHSWACERGLTDLALRLIYALRWFGFWTTRAEICEWAATAARMAAGTGHPLLAEVTGMAAIGASYRTRLQDVETLAARATELARRCGREDSVLGLHALARTTLHHGDLDRCARLSERLIRLAGEYEDPTAAAMWRTGRVLTTAYAGRREEAAAQIAALRREARTEPCPSLRAWTLYGYGEVLSELRPDEALRALREAIDLATAVGNTMILGVASVTIGSIAGRSGDLRAALEGCHRMLTLWHERGGWVHLWTMIRNLVELLARAGRAVDALVLHGAATTSDSSAPPYGEQQARLTALTDRLRGELGTTAYDEADRRGRVMTDEEAVAFALAAIGAVLG